MSHNPDDCMKCRKVGLPILLARPSVYDNRQRPGLIDALPASFDSGSGIHSLIAARSVMRTLRGGWLYVFHEKYKAVPAKRWSIYMVSADGYLTQAPYAGYGAVVGAHQPSSEFACSAKGVNYRPRFLVVNDARQAGVIGIAFSEHYWTHKTLDAFAADADLRAQRMQRIDVSAWVNSGGKAPADTQPLTDSLVGKIAEYGAASAARQLVNAFQFSSYRFATTFLGQADAAARECRTMEAELNLPNKALVMVLRDPVGLVTDANSLRTDTADRQIAWMAGGANIAGNVDAERAWKKQSAELITRTEELVSATRAAQERANLESGVYVDSTSLAIQELFDNLPKGTRKEMLPPTPGIGAAGTGMPSPAMFKIYYPPEEVAKRAAEKGQDRVGRLRERYNHGQMSGFLQTCASEEAEWTRRLKALDGDWLICMKSMTPRLTQIGRVDLDLNAPWHTLYWLPRYAAGMMAGAAFTTETQAWYAAQLQLQPTNPEAWLARALTFASEDLGKELTKQLSSPDSQADLGSKLYDIAKGAIDSYDELKDAGKEMREVANHPAIATGPVNAEALLATAGNVLNQMQAASLASQTYGGVKFSVQTAQRLQAQYVKMAFVQMYIRDGIERHTLLISAEIHEALNWLYEATQVQSALQRMSADDMAGTKSTVQGWAQRVQQGRGVMRVQRVPGGALVDVAVVVTDEVAAELTTTTTYASKAGGPMGSAAQRTLVLPGPQVQKLIAQTAQQSTRGLKSALVIDKGAWLAGAVVLFQGWAFMSAAQQIGKKHGFERADAIAAMISAVAGMAAGGTELFARAWQQQMGDGAKRVLRAKFGVGMLAGLGAAVDGVAAIIKSSAQSRQGNSTASTAYGISGGLFFVASGATVAGSWLAYVAKGGLLGRQAGLAVGRVVATRAAGAAAGAGAAAAGAGVVASWITGIGLVLTIVAVGVMIYGAMMEDDEAEKFLRRTKFGKGGDDNPPFDKLEAEVNEFLKFQYGVRVETNWADNLFSSDAVETEITLGYFKEHTSVLNYQLKFLPKPGRKSKVMASGSYTAGAISSPMEGGLIDVPGAQGAKFLKISTAVGIDDDEFESAVLEYKFWPDGPTGGAIQGKLEVKDD